MLSFNPGFFPIITAEDTKRRREEYESTSQQVYTPRTYKPIEFSTEFIVVSLLVLVTVVAIFWPSKR